MSNYDLSSFDPESLPITHLFLPTSINDTLKKYFLENQDKDECVICGHWEIKSGKPGKIIKPDNAMTASTGKVKVEKSKSSLKGAIFAMSIIGITPVSTYKEQKLFSFGRGKNLQAIGIVRRNTVIKSRSSLCMKKADDDGGASPVFLYFNWNEENNDLAIEVVAWRTKFFYPVRSRLILFYYDPEEFQMWKIPNRYHLGLPQVLLNGLTCIQKGEYHEVTDFHPVFSKVPLDHQDLQACSQQRIVSSSAISSNPIMNLTTRSSGLQQIVHKSYTLMGTLLGTYPLLAVLNFLFLLLVDSLVGYFITHFILQLPDMMGLLHSIVEQMLVKLNHLLKWLRGAPAGLKLNPNLNSLYWRFFSYHIHLWANYIGILEPIFAVILYTIQYFGVVGATIQVSLLKDLISLATFHVYCLYIYATRLYSLQTTAIKALCRVFFGRKYNPLRKRIDSVQLTTPELFLSSFGFVILIFLFPTTMVYYTGFVFLRVPVLLTERLLQFLVITYNKLPIISWLLVYLKSPRVADEIYLVPVQKVSISLSSNEDHQKKNTLLAFRMCLQSTRTLFDSPNVVGGIKSMISSVMDGTVLKD